MRNNLIFSFLLITLVGCSDYRPSNERGVMHSARWTRTPLRLVCSGYTETSEDDCERVWWAARAVNRRVGHEVFISPESGEPFEVNVVTGLPALSPRSTFNRVEREGFRDLALLQRDVVQETTSSAFAILGWRNGTFENCTVGISANIQNDGFYHNIAKHELLHCLNLDHDDYRGSIMNWNMQPTEWGAWPPRISDYDLVILRRLY